MISLPWMTLTSLKGLPELAPFSALRPILHPQGGTGRANTWCALINALIVSQVVDFLVRQFFVSPRDDFAETTGAGSLSEVAIVRILAPPAKPAFANFALYNSEKRYSVVGMDNEGSKG